LGITIFAALLVVLGFYNRPAPAVEIADAPMFTRIQPPPADIMVVLDDSGSMAFEILVRGTYDGRYPNPDQEEPEEDGYCFVFDEMGDHVYTDELRYMREAGRLYWQSQWYETNVMWYNPDLTYTHLARTADHQFEDADPNFPRAHPHPDIDAQTLDLDATSFTVGDVNVNHAHYYLKKGDTIYLILLKEGQIEYYQVVGTTGTGLAEKVTSLGVIEPTDAIRPRRKDCGSDPDVEEFCSYAEERQNFANWFTYYRRREYTAKAALGQVLKNMEAVRVAIYGINERIIMPLYPVKATINEIYNDQSDTLLNELYRFQSRGGTPLKEAFQTVGEFFRNNRPRLAGESGDVPFPDDGGACQQVYTIVMTDGFYSDTGFNARANGADNDDGAPYADSENDTLADIAMYYYENDLSPYADQVPTNKFDKAKHQHMVTYGVAFGVVGTLDPDDYELDATSEDYMKHKTTGNDIVWPTVTGVRQPESIDDLWHAAVNGRGEFLSAANPQELIDALQTLMNSIASRLEGSSASAAVNGDQLYARVSDEVRVFQSSYSNLNEEWTGDVQAYKVNVETGEVLASEPEWSAAEALQTKSAAARKILSYDPVADQGIDFTVAGLTDAQEAEFAPYAAADMVAYIRGQEIDGFRMRSQKLADIVHSAPVFMDNVVYVGANDGMLHAFNAMPPAGGGDPQLGEEIFAYVPNLVLGDLKHLADTGYAHRYYVDLTPVLKQGQGIFGESTLDTLLVGGLGKGGKGYFALDVTNPRIIGKTNVKWEFPKTTTAAADIADVGYSFGRPVIARSYHSTLDWMVIAANGYNSPGDTELGIPAGRSVLFVLNPSDGTVIKKIVADSGPDNGLSTPVAIDVNLDQTVDFVYAGDLKGKLWKFDLRSGNPDDWDVAYKDGSANQPLFIARGPESDLAEAIQPITAKPDVMLHPTKPGYMVYFGTGQFLGDGDVNDRTINTIYGIWDYGDQAFQFPGGWSSEPDPTEYLGEFLTRDTGSTSKQLSNQHYRVKLLKQAATDFNHDFGAGDVTVRVITNNVPEWVTQPDSSGQLPNPSDTVPNNAGWYLDLTTSMHPDGERVVSDVTVREGKLMVIGFNPEDTRCSRGGNSFFMEFDAGSGARTTAAVFDFDDDGSVRGGTIEDPGDYMNAGTPEAPIFIPPSGVMFAGQLQPPAILRFDPPPPPEPPDCENPPCEPPPCDDPPCPPPCENPPCPPPGGCIEVKIFSGTTGLDELLETCGSLGVLYWKEIQQQ
jgi:type IV pilus assembly protein PilY1